jgi:hypothetical protein
MIRKLCSNRVLFWRVRTKVFYEKKEKIMSDCQKKSGMSLLWRISLGVVMLTMLLVLVTYFFPHVAHGQTNYRLWLRNAHAGTACVQINEGNTFHPDQGTATHPRLIAGKYNMLADINGNPVLVADGTTEFFLPTSLDYHDPYKCGGTFYQGHAITIHASNAVKLPIGTYIPVDM